MIRFWAGVVGAVVLSSGCGGGTTCEPGTRSPCSCSDGSPGTQLCLVDGNLYGACVCGGVGGSGGSPSPTSASASSTGVGGAGSTSVGTASSTGVGGESSTSASSTGVGGESSTSSASSTGVGGESSASGASSTGVGSATAATGAGGATGAASSSGQGGSSSSSSGCQGGASSSGAGGQAGHVNVWGAAATSSGQVTVAGVAVDAADNTVVAGTFTDSIDFGCGPIQAVANDIYVAKYASSGALLWVKTFTEGNALAVAVDPSGNILVGGDFAGPLDFGSGTPMYSSRVFAFLAELDPNGGYVWQDSWGVIDTDFPATNAHVRAIAADPLGNLVIIGDFAGPLYFPPAGGINALGSPNFFVTSLDPAGTPAWVTFPGNVTGPMALAVDALGDSIIAAESQGALFLPATSNQCQTSSCVSLAKLGPNGQVLFSEAFGLNLSPDVRAVGVDANDDIAIAGAIPSGTSIDFGGGFVTAPRYPASYVARFDAGGYFITSSGYGAYNMGPGGAVSATPNALACDAAGSCELAGAFQGQFLDFGCGAVDGIVVEASPYLARLDGGDACVASEALPTPTGSANVGAVALASNGDTIAAGNYGGSVDLGSGTLPAPPAGGGGVFVFRRAP